MSHRITDRRQGEVRGILSPDLWYDTEGVFAATGIGEVKLMELRKQGRIAAHRIDGEGRNWYRGADLIGLLTVYAKDQVRLSKQGTGAA